MTHPIAAAAAKLRREVAEAEATLDAALANVAGLCKSIVDARRTLDLPAHTAQGALIRLHAVQGKVVAAQHDMFRCHDELYRVSRGLKSPQEPYKPEYAPADAVQADVAERPAEAAPLRLVEAA